jgi:hypothetical protein
MSTYQPKRWRRTPHGEETVLEYRVLPLLAQHGVSVEKDATGLVWRVVDGDRFMSEGCASYTSAVYAALHYLLWSGPLAIRADAVSGELE